MKIAFYGDSLTDGFPGVSYFRQLQQRLPEHTLLNYGRFNDTAISLHRRIITRRLLTPVDVSILWVGVNDVLVGDSRLFSRLRRWWARDRDEFRIHYRALLDLLTPHAQHLIALSPAIASEQPESSLNGALAEIAELIRVLAGEYTNTSYLDIHALFCRELSTEPQTPHRSPHLLQSLMDTVALRTPEAVDRAAAERGLRLTLDNVHLNSRGSALVTDALEQAIRRFKHEKGSAPPMG